MDWVRNNKFLAAFIAAMVVGVGGVGYFLYFAQSRYDQTSQEYNSQVTELKRLEALRPYPEEANLTRFSEQKAAYGEAVNALQANLAEMAPKAEKATSPTDFQNRLREMVGEVQRSATQFGVALPDGFYLGFEQYRQTLPDQGVSALLYEQLTEVEQMVRLLINHKIDKISAIRRAPLPGEGAGLLTSSSGAGEKTKPVAGELVSRRPVEIAFTASPNAFRETLAAITEAPGLFVVRALQVKNQEPKGPARGQDPTLPGGSGRPPAALPPVSPGAPGDQPLPEKGPPPLRYVVGQEKLDLVMNIELVHVQAAR